MSDMQTYTTLRAFLIINKALCRDVRVFARVLWTSRVSKVKLSRGIRWEIRENAKPQRWSTAAIRAKNFHGVTRALRIRHVLKLKIKNKDRRTRNILPVQQFVTIDYTREKEPRVADRAPRSPSGEAASNSDKLQTRAIIIAATAAAGVIPMSTRRRVVCGSVETIRNDESEIWENLRMWNLEIATGKTYRAIRRSFLYYTLSHLPL